MTRVHLAPPPLPGRWRRLAARALTLALSAAVLGAASAASASTASGTPGSVPPTPAKTPKTAASHTPSPSASSSAAGTRAPARPVAYQGYTFQVPGSWPVISLAAHPQTCVRFDQHAVYLGTPGTDEQCPAAGIGPATEAMLIQPAPATAAVSSVDDPVNQQITVSDARILVTARYGSDRAQVLRILASASLPAPASRTAVPAPVTATPMAATPNAAGAQAAAISTNSSGKGFDTCTAPSSGNMSAWMRSSPYHVTGIYMGGPSEVCAQPNLTSRWVSAQAAHGWSFLPIYCGPQAGSLFSPVSQGTAAAKAAVADAERLGIMPGATLYDDMEPYNPGLNSAVRGFASGWTAELHKYQYKSGVYSSEASGVTALAASYSSPSYIAPDVIYDAWWNDAANTFDPAIPSSAFPYHQRVHQYIGGSTQTWGGYTLNIDVDYSNVTEPYGLARPAATVDSSGTVRVFARFGSNSIYTTALTGRNWTPWTDLGGSWQANPAVLSEPGGRVQVFAVTGNGRLDVDTLNGTRWSGWKDLGGQFQGTPAAVVDRGTVRVIVRGADSGMNEISMSPAGSWSGFTRLGGSWANDAAAVAETNGSLSVFAVGNTGNLYSKTLSGSQWTGWIDLGGACQGVPAAVEDHSRMVRVFVRGDTDGLLEKTQRLGGRWAGFASLGGDWRYDPAVLIGSSGYVWVFAAGINDRLYQNLLTPRGTGFAGWRSLGGSAVGTPAAVQDQKGTIRVYTRATSANLAETTSLRSPWPTDNRHGTLF